MNKIAVGLVASFAFFATTVSAQCRAVIQEAGSNLKVIRSGDLIGDGTREYVAVRMLPKQPRKGTYVSRLVIARAQHGRCSVVLDAGKDGPRNPVGYMGISYIDDGGDFYGYKFDFGSDLREAGPEPRYKCVLFFSWLNLDHKPEGAGIVIGWNEKVGRFQEIDGSWEFFNSELQHPPHVNTKNCGKCAKQPPAKKGPSQPRH